MRAEGGRQSLFSATPTSTHLWAALACGSLHEVSPQTLRPRAPLPDSVRAALAVLSEIDIACDSRVIDATMAGFALTRATLRRWWSEPCDWLAGARPVVLLRRGEGHTVLLAAATALLQSLAQVQDLGDVGAADIIADRLRKSGAPDALVRAVDMLGFSPGSLMAETANER